MIKNLLKLLLFNLMVFSTIISFGQKAPSTSVMNGSQILNSKANSLQFKEYEFPDYSSTNQTEINNSELTSSHQNQNVVMNMKTEFTPWEINTKGFIQDSDYYFYDDFEASKISHWTYHTTGTDICQWKDGKIFFYNQDVNYVGSRIAVIPELDLSKVESATVYAGGSTNGTGSIVFGTLSDANNSTSFTPLCAFNVGLAYQYFTVNITEYTGIDQYFGFKGEGPRCNFFCLELVFMEAKASALNTLTIDVVTNIEESIFNKTSLYPNPASKVVDITSEYSMETVSVYNYLGQEIFTEELSSKLYNMNTSEFDAGIYLF